MREIRSIVIAAIATGLLVWSALAVAAQEGAALPEPPVEFSGHIDCGPEVRSGTADAAPAWQQSGTMSDPRLEGTYYYSELAEPSGTAAAGTAATSATLRIENDEGAWQGSMVYAILSPDGTRTTSSTVLVGEGAYEGLSAILEVRFLFPEACATDVRGLLIEGEVPAAPESFSGE